MSGLLLLLLLMRAELAWVSSVNLWYHRIRGVAWRGVHAFDRVSCRAAERGTSASVRERVVTVFFNGGAAFA